jgi:sugar lactone lactonase YvrE
VVTTVIGNTSATLPYLNASAMAVDEAGNLYAASGIVVRKLTPAGAMSVFAGSLATPGSADGKGAAAGFYQPYGLAIDASGNVIVADTGNDTIRRIDATGTATTLAGSAGAAGCVNGADTDARFNAPAGIAFDGAGNLYVADAGNLNVRMMAPGAGVKTLAGACSGALASAPQGGFTIFDPTAPLVNGTGPAATFGGPKAIAAMGSVVFLSDMESMQINAVRAITSPGGVVTTVAGTLALTLSGPGVRFGSPSGVVADAAGNLYVVDSYYQDVIKFPPDSPAIVLAGYPGTVGSSDGQGNAASFNNPTGLAIDSAGNLYVADTGNNLVRKITPDGTVSTVVGTRGKAGFAPGALPGVLSAPRAVAVSGTSLYIAMANGVAIVQNRP